MKNAKLLLVVIISFICGFSLLANLPCSRKQCHDKCNCDSSDEDEDGNDNDTYYFTDEYGRAMAGSGPIDKRKINPWDSPFGNFTPTNNNSDGNGSAEKECCPDETKDECGNCISGAPGSGEAAVGSLEVKIKFGIAANEKVKLLSHFSIYSDTPTQLLFSPQLLQYRNYLLDRISSTEISNTYATDAQRNELSAHSGSGGYGSTTITNDLPRNIARAVKIFTAKREQMIFHFTVDDPVGKLTGEHIHLNYELKMVDSSGKPSCNSPQYYDLYLKGGRFVRYLISNGQAVSYHTASGRVFSASSPSVGLEAIYEAEAGNVRQVYSIADGLADVVIIEDGISYEIRFYSPEQVGGKVDGLYSATGSPHTVWRIENPTPGQSNRVRVTKSTNNVSEIYDYEYSHNSEGWMLKYPDNLVVETQTASWDYSQTVRSVLSVRKSPEGRVAYKAMRTYQKFPFGSKVVSKAVDPDGANRLTVHSYYTDSNQAGSYGRIKSVSYPNGFWKNYQYDSAGRIAVHVSPWKNSLLNAPASQAQAVYYDYQPVDSRDIVDPGDTRPRTILRKISGITTGKTFCAYFFVDNRYVEVIENCLNPEASYGDGSNLRTERQYYPEGDNASAGRIHKIIYPNGTMQTYTYETGNWNANANPASSLFTPGNGSAYRHTITFGTTANPEGIANKTTREIQIYDHRGCRVFIENQIYTGSGYERATWSVHAYDGLRRETSWQKSNGERADYTWNCCSKESETLPDGTQYTYTYDALKRMVAKTKIGIGDQPNLVTTYEHDAAGRTTKTTTTGGNLSLTSTNEYNLAGQLIKSVNTQGLITTYSYVNGLNTGSNPRGETTIITHPGGTTSIIETHCDKQKSSITGAAQVSKYFDYGVNSDGSSWTISRVGGADSPRYSKVTVNLIGNFIEEEIPGMNGVKSIYTYNQFGQLIKKSTTAKPDILFVYDTLGNQIRQGVDLDQNGTLDLASNDQIIDLESVFQKNGSSWWAVQSQSTYGIANSDTPTVTGISKRRISDFEGNIIGEEQRIDIYANLTTKTISLTRSAKQLITEIQYPDSTASEQQIRINGLMVSSRSPSNLTTTYSYDGLERQLNVTAPRTGNVTYSYHTTDGKIGLIQSVTDASGNTTSYDYDAAGRILWEKNALNQYTRYAYNDRNQIIHIWGDTPYPVMFAYNQYGEQTNLWTFRANADWTNHAWPQSVIGDQTTWSYDPASGLLLSKTDADGKSVTYNYSPDGKLTKRTWARGLFTDYQYDALGQLLKIDYSDDTPDIIYTYNRIGQLTGVQDASGAKIFGYNETFDLISETINGIYNKTITRNYTTTGAKGKVLSMAVDGTNNYTYGYDQYGRLNQITTPAGNFNYSYLANSDLISQMIRPNDVNTTWSYEPNRNLVTQVQNGTISTFGYTNDAIGRRTTMSRNGSAFENADVLNYTYDTRSQVTGALSSIDNNYNYSYNYDPIGNRLTSAKGEDAQSYTTNLLNQYTQIIPKTPQFTYDDDGNMLTNNGWTYTWNAENRLIKAEKGSQTLEFVYDYMGRRISKKVYEGETLIKHIKFVYDKYKLIEDLDGLSENIVIKRYTWQPERVGIDTLLQSHDIVPNQIYYYLTDANKNVSELVNSIGNVEAHYEYTPFGELIKNFGTYTEINPFYFSSEYFDPETELIYYNYRYYNAKQGRWIKRDPIEETDSINLYKSIDNNLLNYWDYLGLVGKWNNKTQMNTSTIKSIQCVLEKLGYKTKPRIVYTGIRAGDSNNSIYGEADYTNNDIYINESLVNDKSWENVIATYLHEYTHTRGGPFVLDIFGPLSLAHQREETILQKASELNSKTTARYYCCSPTGTVNSVPITEWDKLLESCGIDSKSCSKGQTHVATGNPSLSANQIKNLECECKSK